MQSARNLQHSSHKHLAFFGKSQYNNWKCAILKKYYETGENEMKKQLRGSLAIVLATILWGTTFVAQSVGMDYIGPFTFQAVRCFLAVPFLAAIFFIMNPKNFIAQWKNPKLWKIGILCGIALYAATGLQQVALVSTDAGKAGFLTAMYIVIVPILGIFMGKKPTFTIVISVILAVVGLYLLSCVGVTGISSGDLLLLGCAFAFAVQIVLVDRFGQDLNGIQLNCVQSLVCSALSAVTMLCFETPRVDAIVTCWFPLVYAGILSMGVAYTLQIVGQQHVESATASLIMSLEAVVAVLAGWLFLKERMSVYELLGCALVFAAVILSQFPGRKKAKSTPCQTE